MGVSPMHFRLRFGHHEYMSETPMSRKKCTQSKRQRLIHPVVVAKDLLAVKPRHPLGASLRHRDDPISPDGAPPLARVLRVPDEQVVLGRAEHLGAAGISLPCGAAEK